MKIKFVDSLEKVFPGAEPKTLNRRLRCFVGERVSLQVAMMAESGGCEAKISLRSDAPATLRQVGLVPVALPCYEHAHGDYLRTKPGLFPDPLLPVDGAVTLAAGEWHAFWIDLCPDAAGCVKAVFSLDCPEARLELELSVDVMNAELPPQKLLFTQWFHYDCLANSYDLEMWSPKYFDTLEKWLKNYARLGGNTLLTPLFTPPLDTEPGGERLTAQLVGVRKREGGYDFDFSLLRRFVELAKRCGITHFEFSHLFTQWGAQASPKVMSVDGKRLFGWETPAVGDEYRAFLAEFLPALRRETDALGIENSCFLHVSDEPNAEQLDGYIAAKNIVRAAIPDLPIIDALSHYEFYKSGAVERPVVAIDHIQPFIDGGTKPLWGYYCCAQSVDVSNRFIAQSSYQNRAFAAPSWKHSLEGFLQWGHNFYNSQLSKRRVDPWHETDAGLAFPSGDPFSVYPGADGQPVESLRAAVFYQGLCDMRAFDFAAEKLGRGEVLRLLEHDGEVSFAHCDRLCANRRERVNDALEKTLS